MASRAIKSSQHSDENDDIQNNAAHLQQDHFDDEGAENQSMDARQHQIIQPSNRFWQENHQLTLKNHTMSDANLVNHLLRIENQSVRQTQPLYGQNAVSALLISPVTFNSPQHHYYTNPSANNGSAQHLHCQHQHPTTASHTSMIPSNISNLGYDVTALANDPLNHNSHRNLQYQPQIPVPTDTRGSLPVKILRVVTPKVNSSNVIWDSERNEFAATKLKRQRFTHKQVSILNYEFNKRIDAPFLERHELAQISLLTGLTEKQVKKWFHNKTHRSLKR